MSLFARKNQSNPLLDGLKRREVNYVATEWEKFLSDFAENPETLMKMKPVNYYALKKEYIRTLFYSNEDLSKNYVVFSYVEDNIKKEKILFTSTPREVDQTLLKRALSKFGIML